jgi:hypothetical protein
VRLLAYEYPYTEGGMFEKERENVKNPSFSIMKPSTKIPRVGGRGGRGWGGEGGGWRG